MGIMLFILGAYILIIVLRALSGDVI